jgi:hypothetical protein
VARGIILQEEAGAWHLNASIDLALLFRPLVLVAMPPGKTADTMALQGVPKGWWASSANKTQLHWRR